MELNEGVKSLGYINVKSKIFEGVEATIRVHVAEKK
jgi:Ribosomal protein L9, C-terminal domain.